MSKNRIEIIQLNKKGIKDFAYERNMLLQKSQAEWVFFLDSDEVMSSRLLEEINYKTVTSKYDGYYVFRKNYILGKYAGTDKIIRLGKRGKGLWQRRVHEVWNIKGNVGVLENYLIHNTAADLKGYIAKINKYAILHAAANRNRGIKSGPLKILLYPVIKFVHSMITGRGTVMSIMQAFHSFLAWSELWLMKKRIK